MLRVSDDVSKTVFDTGDNAYFLRRGSEIYSHVDQSYSNNLWYVYSLEIGRYGYIDWHDLTLEYCDP